MHVGALVWIVAVIVGAVGGTNRALSVGTSWVVIGLFTGLAAGFLSYVAVTFPYVWIQTKMEPNDSNAIQNWSPPIWWQWMYLPASILVLLLAGFGSWWSVGVIIRLFSES